VTFMHCRDMSTEAVAPLWEALRQAEGVLQLTRRTVVGLQVNHTLMLERAAQDFSTATELADVLVREKGLPFRVAHGIVGHLVTQVLRQGLGWTAVTSTMLEQSAREITGEPLSLRQDLLEQSLDPLKNIAGKHAAGSPSRMETQHLIDQAQETLEQQQSRVRTWQERQDQARRELDQELAALWS
jgi:argininosuccinate lyase